VENTLQVLFTYYTISTLNLVYITEYANRYLLCDKRSLQTALIPTKATHCFKKFHTMVCDFIYLGKKAPAFITKREKKKKQTKKKMERKKCIKQL